jgi:hypothetical protein
MHKENNTWDAGMPADEFDQMGSIQPTAEWTRSVTDTMLGTSPGKRPVVNMALLVPVLLFIIVNGLVVFSIINPQNGKESSREQNFRQMQEELFIHNNPVN